MSTDFYRIETPSYAHPVSGRMVKPTTLIVAATTGSGVALSTAQAVRVVRNYYPSLRGVYLTVDYEKDTERSWCDIPYPERYMQVTR